MLMKLVVAGVVSVAVLTVAVSTRGAHAQYPPPVGNCVIVTSGTSAPGGGSVNVTVTVRDGNGNLQSGVAVPLNVTRQPGTGASVTPPSGTTDASGVVTGVLNVGSTAGAVDVTASPAGMSCSATVTVGTQAVESQVALPNTGTGGSAADATTILFASILLLAAGAVVAGIGLRRSDAS